MFDELIPIFGILLVMIPVAGLTFGLTLRLAVKPFVETLAKAVRESGGGPDLGELSAQIALLQDELEGLREDTRGLKKAQEFDQKLLASLRAGEGGGSA
ncbi:MAG: hypothetical protein ABFS34_09550 [Gemmatimonadota bacterium]